MGVPGDGGSISSSPLVAGGFVYIATNNAHVFKLDLQTGKAAWAFHADDQVMTQPLLVGDHLIIGTGNAKVVAYRPEQYVVLGTGHNEIVAVSDLDGNPIWSLGLPGTGMPTGIVIDNVFYHMDGSGLLVALDAGSGRYLWRKSLASTAFMAALNHANGIFIAAGNWPNRVIAFDALGKVLWTHNFAASLSGFSDCPLAIAGGMVLGDYIERSNSQKVVEDLKPGTEHAYALSLKNGKMLWDIPLESGIVPPFNMSAIPVVMGRVAVVGNAVAPYIHGINIKSGRLTWTLRTNGPVKNGAAIYEGVAYFGDLGGSLWAVDVNSGRVVGRLHFADQFNVGSGVITQSSFIIGSKSGKIYSIPLNRFRR